MLFGDTSGEIRLYVYWADVRPVRKFVQRIESLLISAFTVHELHCGLHRKEFVKALKPGMAEVLYQTFRDEIEAEYFRLIAYNSRVEQNALEVVRQCYGAKEPVLVRVLDAL